MKRDKETELIILKHTKWLWFISFLLLGFMIGYVLGYFMGVFDVVAVYEIVDIKEAINLTNTSSDYVITNIKLK